MRERAYTLYLQARTRVTKCIFAGGVSGDTSRGSATGSDHPRYRGAHHTSGTYEVPRKILSKCHPSTKLLFPISEQVTKHNAKVIVVEFDES